MRKVLILMLFAACSACVFLCGCAIPYDVDKSNDSIYDVSAAWTVNSSGAPVAPQISYGDKSYTIMVNFEEEQIDLSARGASYLQNYEERVASSAT